MDQGVELGQRVTIAGHCYHNGETGVIDKITYNPSGSIAYYDIKLDRCPDNKSFSYLQLIMEDFILL